MTKLILNAKSKLSLDSVISKLPQSLLLTGEVGVGLGTIAKYIAEQNSPDVTVVLPEYKEKVDLDKGTIGVEIIRRLYEQTRTKTLTKQIFIIDYAERMATRAQNAFLKLLEEPGENTYFILTTHTPQKLLPTITSRVSAVNFLPISLQQSNKLIDSLGNIDDKKRNQLLFMAQGLPAELIRLATDDEYFEKRGTIVRDAREMLRGRLYQKLLIAHKYKDSRTDALLLVQDIAKIIKRSIVDKPQASTISHIDSVINAYQRIEANGNIRLCLTRLVL